MASKSNLFSSKPLVLALAATLLILALAYAFLVRHPMLSHVSLDELLPQAETAAYVEFQHFSLPTKLESALTSESVSALAQSATGIQLESLSPSWAKRPFGIVMINLPSGQSQPVLFVASEGKNKMLGRLKKEGLKEESLLPSDEEGGAIYSYSQGKSFFLRFVGPYLFASGNVEPLKLINKTSSTLGQSSAFQETQSNLPRQAWLKAYADPHQINLGQDPGVDLALEPLRFGMEHVALAVRAENEGLHFNLLTRLNKDLMSLKDSGEGNLKFSHKLAESVSTEGLALYFGGKNLSAEWQSTLQSVSSVNPSYGLLLESLARGQLAEFFGEQVDLRNDLYPMVEGEYALSLSSEKKGLGLSLILAHNDPEFMNIKAKKLLEGFQALASQRNPKLLTIDLPDGTQSREMVADESRIEKTQEERGGQKLQCIELEGEKASFCITVAENWLALSNNKVALERIVDLQSNPENNLAHSPTFRSSLGHLSQVSDEISFFSPSELLSLAPSNPFVAIAQSLLNPFEGAAWVKRYFEGGMSVEGYVLAK